MARERWTCGVLRSVTFGKRLRARAGRDNIFAKDTVELDVGGCPRRQEKKALVADVVVDVGVVQAVVGVLLGAAAAEAEEEAPLAVVV